MAESGQIVAALIDNEATLKRYCPALENYQVWLYPENSRMDDIYGDHCVIQGVATKELKDLH